MNDLVYKIVNKLLFENSTDEKRQLSAPSKNHMKNVTTDFAKKIYGDERYGKKDEHLTNYYFPKGDGEVTNDLDIDSGMFAVGNEKLSDDTLIINFTSALGCPSINDCPISQKACYAVAGENRLATTRRKNIKVQKAAARAYGRGMLDGFFTIAEEYVKEFNKTKRPIKYIRFNEVGDFPNQVFLDMAAKFAYKMKELYGIKSMAYTANTKIDPSKEIEVGNDVYEPIDTIIAMNRSRSDIKRSENSLDRTFYGIEMPRDKFSADPDVNLNNAYSDVVEVTDALANTLKVAMPIKDETGDPCIPILNYGKWGKDGSGFYYVCPCSFWKYNKIKAANKFLKENGIFELLKGDAVDILSNQKSSLLGEKDPEILKNNKKKTGIITKAINVLKNIESYPDNNNGVAAINKGILTLEENGIIPAGTKKQLDNVLSKVKSPCGVKCSVCHDTQGGITPNGNLVKNYSILTATHGGTASNYHEDYANAKRLGLDKDSEGNYNKEIKYSEDNPFGQWTGYKDIADAKKQGNKLSKDEIDKLIKGEEEDSTLGESIVEKIIMRSLFVKNNIIKENKENFYKILGNITKIK